MTALADIDRLHIAQARELAAAPGQDGIREYLTRHGIAEAGELKNLEIYPFAFGSARSLLAELADLAERLADESSGDSPRRKG